MAQEEVKLLSECKLLFKLFTNGYNMLEPEHSQKFIRQQVEILIPQVFGVKSVLEQEKELDRVAKVYYKEDSDLIKRLREIAPSVEFR